MDLKENLCNSEKPLGKITEWVATAGKTTVVEIDVSDMDVLEIACPCCMFWRGVVLGGAFVGALAWLMDVLL